MKPVPGLPIEQQPEPVVFACVLCAEARSLGRPGMEAVAQVIMNRAADPKHHFGDSIKAVCLKPWAFSCLNANDPQRDHVLGYWQTQAQSYALAEAIVAEAMGGALPDTAALAYLVSYTS